MTIDPAAQPNLRIEILRDQTNSRLAAGAGRPWMAYCPCCACHPGFGFFASFSAWHSAINWAVQHARTVHTPSTVYKAPEVAP